MGSFGSGFAQAIGQHIHDRAEEQHKIEMARKQALAQTYDKAIANTSDPDDPNLKIYQDARDSLYKTPGMKDVLQKARTAVAIGMRHPEWAGKSAQDAAKTKADTEASAARTAAQSPQGASTPGLPAPPMGSSASSAPEKINSASSNDRPKSPDDDSAAADAAVGAGPTSNLPSPGPESALSPDAGSLAPSTNLTGAGSDTLHASLVKPGAIPPPPLPSQPAPLPAANYPAAIPPPPGQQAPSAPSGAPQHQQLEPWVAATRAANPSPSALQERAINLYEAQHQIAHKDKMEEVVAEAAARAANNKPVFGPVTSVRQARSLAPMGRMYPDENGNPIDLTTLPDEMGLKYVAQGAHHWYEPFSPNQKQITVGNMTYTINPADVDQLVGGAGTPLGAKNAGTSRTNPRAVIVNGKPAFVPTTSGSTPSTPGITGRPNVPSSPAAQSGAAATSPHPDSTHLTPPRTIQATPGASPNHKGGTIAPPPGMAATSPTTGLPKGSTVLPYGTSFPGQFTQQQKRNTAINDAGMALEKFTSPQDNGNSNLDIFKDPKAVQRVGNYLSLNNQQIEGDFNAAEKGGTDGVLSFYAGIPTAYAQQSTKAVKDAYGALTPQDKRFVSDYYFLLGNWGGMRAASGASGSKWNFNNLSQEIPNPMSISSYDEARRKVEDNMAEFDQVSKPNQTVRGLDKSKMFPTQKKGMSAGPAANPKVMTPPPGAPKQVKTAQDFLSKYGVQ